MNEKTEWKRIDFDELPSTNEYVKSYVQGGGRENRIVIAKKQSAGRGTKGRSFSSTEGGVYLTKLTHYENFLAKDAFLIMAGAALAVCRTLSFYGLTPKIKWPNDVFVADKKICGILIENVFSGNKVARSIVGIGVNVSNSLPKELRSIATTMQEQGVFVAAADVTERLIEELQREISMDEYLSFLGYMGRTATILHNARSIPATLLYVDTEGALWAETAEGKQRFTAAEVSLRLI